jgi:Mg2+ and Co2+ transporter CorA
MAGHENLDNVSARSRRESLIDSFQKILERLEERQTNHESRLNSVEEKLDVHLSRVADHTAAISANLALIQQTNSKLIDVISQKSTVSATTLVLIITIVSGVFFIRELSIGGGKAKIGLNGVDIEAAKP